MWRNVAVFSAVTVDVSSYQNRGGWVCRSGNEISRFPVLNSLSDFMETKSNCTGRGLPTFQLKYESVLKKKSSSNKDPSLGLWPCFAEMQSTLCKLQSADALH